MRSPHFIIISNAGEKRARHTAIQFEQIRAVFREVSIPDKPGPAPVIPVLALKDEQSLRLLIPQFWKGDHARPAGVFSHRLGQCYIAIDLSAPGPNPYTGIYHEFFHSLTTPYIPGLPAWLAEGLADFYGATEIDRAEASVGLPDESMIGVLKARPLLPFPALFQVDHSSPYYNQRNKQLLFHAESWAVTDYLMVGDHGAHRPLLFDYIARIKDGAGALDAARAEFGDLAKFEMEVTQYMRCWPLDYLHAPAPPPLPDSDLSAREISQTVADIYRGGFLAVEGQPGHAVSLLKHAIEENPSSGLAYQNLTLALFFAARKAEALDAASRTIALNPTNAIARYIRAYCSFHGTMLERNPQMEADLRAAIAADPGFAPPYAFMAAYLAAQGRDLTGAYAYARRSVSLVPSSSMYQLVLAKVLGRMDRLGESRRAALIARAQADDSADRAAADSFLAFLAHAKNVPQANALAQQNR